MILISLIFIKDQLRYLRNIISPELVPSEIYYQILQI